jgi:hypothetical protein
MGVARVPDALAAAREALEPRDPREAAAACGFTYESDEECGEVRGTFLDSVVRLALPAWDFAGECDLPPHVRAIVLRHLAVSDGSEPSGQWTTFTELPDGLFYVRAYRGYTGQALLRELGPDVAHLEQALDSLGAGPVALPGDLTAEIPVLPRLPVAFSYWEADEEFAARADFLFDETAGRHLPTDCIAVCCSWITHRIVAAARAAAAGDASKPKTEQEG